MKVVGTRYETLVADGSSVECPWAEVYPTVAEFGMVREFSSCGGVGKGFSIVKCESEWGVKEG